jgi:branched-chain amino acid aminotransferase/4-amino-4-deoxychorismate lyase
MIPADDRGFTLGVGLFETLLVIDGVPRFWREHLDRLERGCAALGLPPPSEQDCALAADKALSSANLEQGRAALRLTWTGGSGARGLPGPANPQPRLVATAAPAPEPPTAISLAIVCVRRNPSSLTSRYKTLCYLDNVMARQEAVAAGADEALLLNTDGMLSGAAAANLFWFRDDVLYTPSLACGVLDGIMRAHLLRTASAKGLRVEEIEAEPKTLFNAESAFLTSSLIGCVFISMKEESASFLKKRSKKLLDLMGFDG